MRHLSDCSARPIRTKVRNVRRHRRPVMTRWIAGFIAAVARVGTGQAYGQDATPGPGTVVVTIIPGGGTFFTESKNTGRTSFGNYDLGAGVTVHLNRYVGIEGEVSGAVGVAQDLLISGRTSNLKSPNSLNYSGNLVVSAANRSSVVPYVTAGVGGLSLFEKSSLGINGTDTFFTSNVGGGVNWYAGRCGLRGDYRFIAVQS